MPKSFATQKFSGLGASKASDGLELITFVEGVKASKDTPISEGDALTFDLKGSVPGRAIWGEVVTIEVDGRDGPGLTTDQLRAGVALPAPAFDVSLRGRLGHGRNTVHGVSCVPERGRKPAAPFAKGALPDLTLSEGSGVTTVDAAADFVGDDLVFALPVAPRGVTLEAGPGLVAIDTQATGPLSGVTIVVRATNATGSADSAFSLTVETAANHAPIATGDSATVAAGATILIDVLANDTDLDGDDLRVVDATTDIGTVSLGSAPNHLLTFDAGGLSAGDVATIVYTVSDGTDTAIGEATVTVVAAANRPPVATGDNAIVSVDGTVLVDVLANDLDLDGDSLKVVAASANIGRVTVGPAPDYLLSFDAAGLSAGDVATIAYTVSDGTDTAAGEATVTVEASKDALYRDILSLSDPANAGRTSTKPLTVVDAANPPAGSWWRGDINELIVDGTDVVFEDLDFRGLHVQVEGTNITFRQCLFGYADGEASGPGKYYVSPGVGASNVLFEDCTLDGGGDLSHRAACVVFDGIAPDGAKDVTFRRFRCVNVASDYIKPGGVRTLFDRVYMGLARNVPDKTTYYNPALAYAAGAHVLYDVGQSYRLYKAVEDVPPGEEPSGSTTATAYWKNDDKHLDGFQVASFKDMTIRDTLIEMFSKDADGNLIAIGVTNALRFAPNTNRDRTYDNLLISGMVIRAPYGGFYPISFSTNIRGWRKDITYSTSVQKYCRVGCAVFQSRIDDNLGNDPTLDPAAWAPVRDYAMPGPLRVENLWLSAGRNGGQALFNSGSSMPISSAIMTDPSGDPLPDHARPNLEIVESRPTPGFGSGRLCTNEIAHERYDPAQEFVITPTAYKTVLWTGKRISALPLYVGGIGVGAIGEDGALYTVDGEGVTLSDNVDGTFSLTLYDHAGNAMEGSLQIPTKTATAISRPASVPTGGPAWGSVDKDAPALSDLSTDQTANRIGWTITTDEDNGTLFGVLLPAGSPAPSGEEIIAGTDGSGAAATASFEVEVTEAGILTGSIAGLPEATEYDLHIVQRDEALNISAPRSVATHTDTSEILARRLAGTTTAPRLNIPNGLAANGKGEITVLVRMAIGDATAVSTVHRFIEAHGREFAFELDLRGNNSYRRAQWSAEQGGSNAIFLASYAPDHCFGKVPATFVMSITLDDGSGNAIARIWKNGVLLGEKVKAAASNTTWSQRDIYMNFMSSVNIAVNDFAVWRAFTPDGSLPDDASLVAPRLTGGADVFNAPPAPYVKSGADFV